MKIFPTDLDHCRLIQRVSELQVAVEYAQHMLDRHNMKAILVKGRGARQMAAMDVSMSSERLQACRQALILAQIQLWWMERRIAFRDFWKFT